MFCRRFCAKPQHKTMLINYKLEEHISLPFNLDFLSHHTSEYLFVKFTSPVAGEFPSQRPVTQSFDVFFDLCMTKRLSKQSWGWWFETRSRSLWRHCSALTMWNSIVYPKKYAHGFCFAVLCCGYTLTDFPISIRLTSLALWQSNDCPSASKATLMNMNKYFMWIHYERLHNHNKAKHDKPCAYFLGYTVASI